MRQVSASAARPAQTLIANSEVSTPAQPSTEAPTVSNLVDLPPLDAWFDSLIGASALTPALSVVMPMGFGGHDRIDNAAWHGDKALGMAMAAVLNSHGVLGKDNLTRRYGALLSNANLMLRMDEILPQHVLKLLPPPGTRSLQVHDCGTVVEACAKFVYDSGDTRGLHQLAEYLYAADARDAAPHLGERLWTPMELPASWNPIPGAS